MTTPLLRRRWLPQSLAGKAAAVFVAGVILIVVAWTAALGSAYWRLASALEEAHGLGYRDSWEKLAGPTVPDEDNAAFPMAEVARLVDVAYRESKAAKLSWPKTSLSLSSDVNYERMLDDADRRPRYRTRVRQADLDPTKTAQLSDVGCLGMTLVAETECSIARDLIGKGQAEKAVDRMLRLLRITRKWTSHEPLFISHNLAVNIRGSAVRILNHAVRAGLSASVHDDIERETSCHDLMTQQSALAANGVRDMHLTMNRQAWIHRHAWAKPLAVFDAAAVHEETNDYARTVHESYAAYQSRPKPKHPLSGLPWKWVGSPAGAGLANARMHFDGSTALVRCLRIVNAMAAKKNWSAELDSFGLPSECLIDPFDGERLRIKRTPDGPIVYSIGGDLTDEGGKLDDARKPYDIGLGPVAPGKK